MEESVKPGQKEIAVLGGGCFWCSEAVFKMIKGVSDVLPGYAGGVEVVHFKFDPAQISFHDLLTVFFSMHDPTSRDKQGNDIGPQYRSAIFYTNLKQGEEADKYIRQLNEDKIGPPIVTEVNPLEKFIPADPENLNYYFRHKESSYCQLVISPKLEKVRQEANNLLHSHLRDQAYVDWPIE